MACKCVVCGKRKGYACLLRTIKTRILAFLSNPLLFFWIIKTFIVKDNISAQNTTTQKNKLSFFGLIKQKIIIQCEHYDLEYQYQSWITNAELQKSTAQMLQQQLNYVWIVDEHAILADNALVQVSTYCENDSSVAIFFGGYDYLTKGVRHSPLFQLGWNKYLFYSYDYLGPVLFVRQDVLELLNVGALPFNDAKRFIILHAITNNLKINALEGIIAHKTITHEKVLQFDSHFEAINRHLLLSNSIFRIGHSHTNSFGILIPADLQSNTFVSIIIPTHNQWNLLKNCIESILNKTDIDNYEIIVVDNNSNDEATIQYLKTLSLHPKLSIIEYNKAFNFSAINNYAVTVARGNYICFLNNDTEVISDKWLSSLLVTACIAEVGAVGAKLLYEDRTIQHAGISMGLGGIAGHRYRNSPNDPSDYRISALQEVSGVTAACLCIEKKKFWEVCGFDEHLFQVAFNDVDLCLKLTTKGYLNIYVPEAELFHFEGKSRGNDFSIQQSKRYRAECENMLNKWGSMLKDDSYYNKYLTKDREDARLMI